MKTYLRSSSNCLVTQILNQKPSEWNCTPTDPILGAQNSQIVIFHDKRYAAAWKGCRASKWPEGQKWTGCPFWPELVTRFHASLCKKNTACSKYSLNDMQHMWVTAPRRGWVTPGQEPAQNTPAHTKAGKTEEDTCMHTLVH